MKILKRARSKVKELSQRLKAYFKRLLFPLYLFPVKLLTYSIYYILKFSTKNWDGHEVSNHYYEGTWQTVVEDGVYKMLKSDIKEVENPDYNWYYQ